jgi:hypothetical protein
VNTREIKKIVSSATNASLGSKPVHLPKTLQDQVPQNELRKQVRRIELSRLASRNRESASTSEKKINALKAAAAAEEKADNIEKKIEEEAAAEKAEAKFENQEWSESVPAPRKRENAAITPAPGPAPAPAPANREPAVQRNIKKDDDALKREREAIAANRVEVEKSKKKINSIEKRVNAAEAAARKAEAGALIQEKLADEQAKIARVKALEAKTVAANAREIGKNAAENAKQFKQTLKLNRSKTPEIIKNKFFAENNHWLKLSPKEYTDYKKMLNEIKTERNEKKIVLQKKIEEFEEKQVKKILQKCNELYKQINSPPHILTMQLYKDYKNKEFELIKKIENANLTKAINYYIEFEDVVDDIRDLR